jgi:hypothetical protein
MTVAEHDRMKGAENGAAQASVSIAGTTYDLPVRKGTLGPGVIDISTLYQDTGRFTYDPGFASTASCESKITFIDFEKGEYSIAVIRSNNSPRTARFLKHVTSCSTASCRLPNSTRRLNTASLSTPWCMSN